MWAPVCVIHPGVVRDEVCYEVATLTVEQWSNAAGLTREGNLACLAEGHFWNNKTKESRQRGYCCSVGGVWYGDIREEKQEEAGAQISYIQGVRFIWMARPIRWRPQREGEEGRTSKFLAQTPE